jgi:hypothetical protein
MYRKSVIPTRARVLFNPSNYEHMKDYATFIKTSNWSNGCNYLLEDPYMDIPTMINEKIVQHVLRSY